MKLKELDRNKQQGIKFSKAFSEFTVLVYHNIFGPGYSEKDHKHNSSQSSVAK